MRRSHRYLSARRDSATHASDAARSTICGESRRPSTAISAKCVADVVGLVFTLEALVAAAPRKRKSA
jgi:hypothetical protein